ncbi:MAG: O-antigen ligase family protein [Armatimonas sp.]
MLLGLTAYLAGYAQYLAATGGGLIQDETLRSRGSGIFGDPNDLSATIVVGISLALFRAREANGWRRALYILLTGFFVYESVMTQSRGGFLALTSAFVGFIIFSNFKKSIKIGALVFLAAAFVLASGRMANFDSSEESANSRFWFWVNGIEHFFQTPVIGIGWRNFLEINGGMTAHNTFVLCFTELGLVGYFFWMGCLYVGFTTPPALRNIFQDEECRYDLMGARVALGSFLVAVYWISRTYVPIVYIFISLPVVAMNCYANKIGVELPSSVNSKAAMRIFGICIASIAFIYIMALRLR